MENKAMFDKLLLLYGKGVIDENGLTKAVKLGWLTPEQKIQIIGLCTTEKVSDKSN